MTIDLRTPIGVASLVAVFLLSSCGGTALGEVDKESSSRSSAPPTPSTPSPTPTESDVVEPEARRQTFTAKVGGYTLRSTMARADRFRQDGAYAERLHLLRTTSSGLKKDPWADLFLYVPTKVYDPATQRLAPAPGDLLTWLASNPGVRVLLQRSYAIRGVSAHEVNVQRDGSMLFEGDRSDDAPGTLERYILVRRDGVWLVGQASTFEGKQALTRPARPGDALLALVRNARISKTR
jgi:hypothetical protein